MKAGDETPAHPSSPAEAPRGEARAPRALDPTAPVLGRIGSLEVRLARTVQEIRAAQALRYHVFFEEMNARPSPRARFLRRDADGFDRFCDHLLVIDRAGASPRIVGTYRLLTQEMAARAGGFYSAGEFTVADLVARHPGRRFLELGRSCVLAPYRGKRTVELLWQGIWAYVGARRIDVLFGCASFAGTDGAALAGPLAFLRDNAAPPAEWSVAAVAGRPLACVAAPEAAGDPRRIIGELPPLLKGYLRLGGYVGSQAVVDHAFGTTDVLVVLPVERINPRYVSHYGPGAERFAA